MVRIMQLRVTAAGKRLARRSLVAALAMVAAVACTGRGQAQSLEPFRLQDESIQFASHQPVAPPPPAPTENAAAPYAAIEQGDVKPLDRVALDVLPPVGKFPERPSHTF